MAVALWRTPTRGILGAVKRSTAKTRAPLGLRGDHTDGLRLRDIVGGAHVVVGAIGIVGLMVAMIFGDLLLSAGWLVGMGVVGLIHAATVLSGLWIRDGKPRGAALAVCIAIARIGLSLYQRAFGLDLVIAAVLLAGAVYVWPALRAEGNA
jgi:hypothetical protein